MKLLRLISLIIALFMGANVVSAQGKQVITVKGSDTMVILAQRWAEVYMKKNKGIVIQVTGGGSGTGIAALMNKTTDLANSSRPIRDKERQQIEAGGAKLIEIPVALDGISVYVNNANPLKEIDMATLKEIFTGRIDNWSQLGWEDKRIKIYSRENNSGTYMFFKEHVLGNEDFSQFAQHMPGTAAVLNAVKKDKYGIGYGGIGYLRGVKVLKISKEKGGIAYEPSMENVVKGIYPLSRYLFIYLTDETFSRPEVKSYISWILSKEGQKIISEVGYYPIPEKDIKRIRKELGL